MNDMFFLSPARNLQGIKWRHSLVLGMLGATYCSSLVRGILDRLLPEKQVGELSRAVIEVPCHAKEMAIPLTGLSHSFLTKTSDSNVKVESNSCITGFPAEGTVTITLHRNLCCNPIHCGGYDRDIPAEAHSSSNLFRTHAVSVSRECVSSLTLRGDCWLCLFPLHLCPQNSSMVPFPSSAGNVTLLSIFTSLS